MERLQLGGVVSGSARIGVAAELGEEDEEGAGFHGLSLGWEIPLIPCCTGITLARRWRFVGRGRMHRYGCCALRFYYSSGLS